MPHFRRRRRADAGGGAKRGANDIADNSDRPSRRGAGEAAYAAPAHSSHFTGAQPAPSTTSNAARGKLAALEQGRRRI
jgi:hypothetical protein